MKIAEFFDPYSPDHMLAYSVLCETGQWPEGFLPLGLDSEYDPAWQVKIVAKIADAWVNHMTVLRAYEKDAHDRRAADLEDLKSGLTDKL